MSNQTDSPKKQFSLGKKILFTLTLLFFLWLLVTVAGEIAIRICCSEKYSKPDIPPPYNTAQKDQLLGWKMTPGYTWEGTIKDFGGNEYDVNIRYDENGFKAFGDTLSNKPKVFFIGDSYTACIEVSNEKSFYNIIKDSLGIEVFAYGHAGYGTLQEYLILDRWIDVIKPDCIVWETCSNDFIDNYAPLEIVCGYKVGERRPYLGKDGSIYYERPLSTWQKIQEKIYFYKWLEERWKVVQQNLPGKPPQVGEYYIATEKRNFKPFDEAVLVTEQILENVAARIPDSIDLIGFSADTYQPQLEEFNRIFHEQGFVFTADAAKRVEKTGQEENKVTKAVDGYHWNETGHQLVAIALIPYIRTSIHPMEEEN